MSVRYLQTGFVTRFILNSLSIFLFLTSEYCHILILLTYTIPNTENLPLDVANRKIDLYRKVSLIS